MAVHYSQISIKPIFWFKEKSKGRLFILKTKYYEYNKQVSGEKYSEFTESEYLKAREDKNRWFISFGDSVLECEESEYRDYFSEKNHSDYTQRDKYGKKIIPILLDQYTYSDSACVIVSDSTGP